MKQLFKSIPGSITTPLGYSAAGVFCDIKKLGTGKGSDKGTKRDLGIIYSEAPATVAGMFTTNQVCAAPVKWCVKRVEGKVLPQAIVVNSGNANACTGDRGMHDAEQMAHITARCLNLIPEAVLVGSTGRIGVNMPMDNVEKGIVEAASSLQKTVESAENFTESIMTSDTHRKEIAVEFTLSGKKVRIGGVCKGAGMIQPGMSSTGKRPAAMPLHATMLGFITTDAAISKPALKVALQEAVAQSFNRITVDGDMSTNDTVLILANGKAENPKMDQNLMKNSPQDFEKFQAALNHVTLELAKKIVRDGEGVSRFVTVRVAGARNQGEADQAARSVANSALVKTSWCGGDPNWGRILDALGYSPARVVEEKIDLGYSLPQSRKIVYSLKKGQPTKASFKDLCSLVANKEFELHINLNLGEGRAVIYAADLTEAYVDFNKGSIGDPSAMGG